MQLVTLPRTCRRTSAKGSCLTQTLPPKFPPGRFKKSKHVASPLIRFASSSEFLVTSSSSIPEPIHPEIGQVLFSRADIQRRVSELGAQIGADYQDKDLVLVGVLKGAFKFTSDLVTAIDPLPKSLEVDFMSASSYHKRKESSGHVQLSASFQKLVDSVRGKHVLIVEDVLDSGRTLSTIVKCFRDGKYPGPEGEGLKDPADEATPVAASVRVVVLLDKRAKRVVPFEADYVGFDCPDEFIVGYGIDYAERYRYLPYVGVPNVDAFK